MQRMAAHDQDHKALLNGQCESAMKARTASYVDSLFKKAASGIIHSLEIENATSDDAYIDMITIWSGGHIVHATEANYHEGCNGLYGCIFGQAPGPCTISNGRSATVEFAHPINVTSVDICQSRNKCKLTLIAHGEDEKMELFRQNLLPQEMNNMNIMLFKEPRPAPPPSPLPTVPDGIRIIGAREPLHIRKIMVWSGEKLLGTSNILDAEISSRADSQSSPMRAFDYNIGTSYAFHTKNGGIEWVLYSLPRNLPVTKVEIHNRSDVCQERLASFKLQIMRDDKVFAERQLTKEAVQTYNF